MSRLRDVPAYDAAVLAGGAGRRMGGIDKCALRVGGVRLLDHVVGGLAAERVVVVGPRRPMAAPVEWAREHPPGGGPVAALATGLAVLGVDGCDVVAVLAGDAPYAAGSVPRLMAALAGHEAALLVDADGHVQPLVAAYDRDALGRVLAGLPATSGAPMRRVVDALDHVRVPGRGDEALDCDDVGALARARSVWEERHGA